MPAKRDLTGHTEFGGGPGLIDPASRAAREVTPEQMMMELYASDPDDPKVDLSKTPIGEPKEVV